MSKQEGNCKYFINRCKSIANSILSAWGEYNCYYDGGPYSKKDFVLRGRHSWGTAYCKWDSHDKAELYEALREAGATNIIGKFSWNYFDIAFDLKKKNRKQYDEQEQADIAKAKQEHLAKLNAIDVTPYVPDQKTIDKLNTYKDKGTFVNLKAIKDINKVYTYYYASRIIKWKTLEFAILSMDTIFGHKVNPEKKCIGKNKNGNGKQLTSNS